ncbi:MAG: Mov34/MPN/PAD-1 family protein [Candidatus Nitrosotenuis sp.]
MDDRNSHSRISLEKTLIITENQKQVLVEHAKKHAPNESCALLFGKENQDSYSVKEIFLTTNTDKSPINFTISNEELLRGYEKAEKSHLDVIGIFHSHPHSEAMPSSTDRKFMEVNPVIWVIFSNKLQSLEAYILESEIKSVPIKTI